MATLALFVFPLLVAFAGASDLLTMRISNRVVLAIVVLFFAFAIWAGLDLEQFAWHLGLALAVLAVTFAFFAFGWIGGGDAKLAAAIALWLGTGILLLQFLVYAAVLGGALTLIILLLRRLPLTPMIARFTWLARLHDAKSGVPYGIALAAAGLIVYTETPIYQYFAG